MKVILIGSNGLLSDAVGRYCNSQAFDLMNWGLLTPTHFDYNAFHCINLMKDELDYNILLTSDVIIYAVGAGIQSNLKEDISLIYSLNVMIPISILNKLTELSYNGVFVSFGSYFEIGKNTLDLRFTERDIIYSPHPVPNDYCVSKRILTRFLDSKKNICKHLHIILPTIYGEYEAENRLIKYTVNCLLKNEKPRFTNGNQVRQFLYVEDVPIIIFRLIQNSVNGIINLPGPDTLTVREVVEKVYTICSLKMHKNLFGSLKRVDIGMLNLQLSDELIAERIEKFKYTTLDQTINKYVSLLLI